MLGKFFSVLTIFLLISCSEISMGSGNNGSNSSASKFEDSIHGTYASTYVPLQSENIIIKNSTLFDGNGNKFENYDIHFSDGDIKAIGSDLNDDNAIVIDGTGKFVTPGIIDNHSHMGVYPAPGVSTSSDGNEATNPVTAEVWAEHSVWTEDPQYKLALAGGITTFHVLPGSANLFGGRGVTLKKV